MLSVSACSVVERIVPEDLSSISAADEIDGLAREIAGHLGWTFINRLGRRVTTGRKVGSFRISTRHHKSSKATARMSDEIVQLRKKRL
jgi:hypothetical protein